MKSIEEIVNEVFQEASNGVVYVGAWRYFLRFYNNIEGISNAKNNVIAVLIILFPMCICIISSHLS